MSRSPKRFSSSTSSWFRAIRPLCTPRSPMVLCSLALSSLPGRLIFCGIKVVLRPVDSAWLLLPIFVIVSACTAPICWRSCWLLSGPSFRAVLAILRARANSSCVSPSFCEVTSNCPCRSATFEFVLSISSGQRLRFFVAVVLRPLVAIAAPHNWHGNNVIAHQSECQDKKYHQSSKSRRGKRLLIVWGVWRRIPIEPP